MDYDEDIRLARLQHRDALEELWRLIRLVRRDEKLSADSRNRYLTDLYSQLSSKDVRGFFVWDSSKYDIGVSFRSSINNTRRFKSRLQRYGWRIAPGSNSKVRDREFGQQLGVPTPHTYVLNATLTEVPLLPKTIIKPMSGAGARGVMYVDPLGRIHPIAGGEVYHSIGEAESHMPDTKESGSPTRWLVEDAILDGDGHPANDMKVYMFYGEPGLYLEIARGAGCRGKDLYAVHNSLHQEIKLGPKVQHFSGSPVPDDVLDKARRVSLATPVPFVRVDFHMGASACVLGEITPYPGGTYAGDLYDEVDRELGKLFVEAEARLFLDLLGGKTFDKYLEVYKPNQGR